MKWLRLFRRVGTVMRYSRHRNAPHRGCPVSLRLTSVASRDKACFRQGFRPSSIASLAKNRLKPTSWLQPHHTQPGADKSIATTAKCSNTLQLQPGAFHFAFNQHVASTSSDSQRWHGGSSSANRADGRLCGADIECVLVRKPTLHMLFPPPIRNLSDTIEQPASQSSALHKRPWSSPVPHQSVGRSLYKVEHGRQTYARQPPTHGLSTLSPRLQTHR